ncbi:MAG: hypothetical protein DDG59_14930 [Anaerolineae bacterium]|nr:MAG: hypothetical protein DDG59_14930 [Anaerolineae bacterium]
MNVAFAVARDLSRGFRRHECRGTNELRNVSYYLIRGRRQGNVKVCLVHGSFFETVTVMELIQNAFSQVIQNGMNASEPEIDTEIKDRLIRLLSHQAYFRKSRDVPQASVKLRFRVMTEVKKEGNLLNSQQYPQIVDNSLNLVLPCSKETEQAFHFQKLSSVVEQNLFQHLRLISFRHPLNGLFIAFQIQI